jgi:hypothetical protein
MQFENNPDQSGGFHTPPLHGYQNPMHEQPMPPVQPEPSLPAFPASDGIQPIPVVRVLSPVGVEYVFLTITLLVGASALVSALLTLVNGGFSFLALAFPVATLLVSVPVFAAIFLHLKRLEMQHPRLQLDPSKRRSTQATQIISFIVSLFTLIGFVAVVFASLGGGLGVPVGKAALDALCVLVVAGGILFYYWRDEHGVRR